MQRLSYRRARYLIVDAWGRLIGPDTVVPLSPAGDRRQPNHCLWEQKVRYPSYSRTIREYLQRRLTAEPEGTAS